MPGARSAAAAALMALVFFEAGASKPLTARARVRATARVDQTQPAATGSAALATEAFASAYNLDYASALATARRAVAAGPNDARAHRTLASILWLQILFDRGAVTVDHFLRGFARTQGLLPPVPPALDAEFTRELQRAIDLSEAALTTSPSNLDARDEAASCYALQASYLASVRGSTTGAFGPAKRAFDDATAVLARDPTRPSALCIVGLYRYVVSTFGLPTRWFAYLLGLGADREQGIAMLDTASRAGSVEASVSLVLIDTREGRHLDALRLARQLATSYPRNRLFVLEAGSAAVRAGRGADADALLTIGLAALDADPRPHFPGERAQWLLERAMARTERDLRAAARSDVDAAATDHPSGWVEGRLHLQRGRLDDLDGRRAEALTEYRLAKAICDAQRDDPCRNDAVRLLDHPFRGQS